MDDARILGDLHLAIERLADAIADEPPVAGALRRFAAALPASRRAKTLADGPPDPTAIRGLLYRALDAGTLDAHRFDWLMIARGRAARARLKRAVPREP